jgi:hypothetical protein
MAADAASNTFPQRGDVFDGGSMVDVDLSANYINPTESSCAANRVSQHNRNS